jgi:ribonuclease VapC
VIVETSALIAIVKGESDAADFHDTLIEYVEPKLLSAASYLEAGIVTDGLENPKARAKLDELIELLDITVVPFTANQSRIARKAYSQYGKGSGHSAQLNFSDCFAYALAKDSGKPLLFKGDDFAKTDVKVASA